METYKVIFSGRLEFGNEKSFEKVSKMYQHRIENYYKKEIILNWEEVFDAESAALNIPRLITQGSEKWWNNTINLLGYVSEFAVAGDLSAWMVNNGTVMKHIVIEPKGDKAAVQSFIAGRELIQQKGKEEEAKLAFSNAIEKFSRHAKAYERRGYVNYVLGNYEDALYDYSKSLDINPNDAESYLGRGMVKMSQNKIEEAMADFELCCKNSMPLQSKYWQARRLKAECHVNQNDHEAAIKELNLFVNRVFDIEDANYRWKRYTWYLIGKAQLGLSEFKQAAESFGQALKLQDLAGSINDAELLLYRGIALHEAGQAGFKNDWELAAGKGSKKAAALLAEVA